MSNTSREHSLYLQHLQRKCASALKLLEYQSRSAEEAHTIQYKCLFCPLDSSKFPAPLRPPQVHLSVSEPVRKRTLRVILPETSSVQILVMSRECSEKDDTFARKEAIFCNIVDSSLKLFRVYLSGPWKGKAVNLSAPQDVAPNASLVNVVFCEDNPRNTNSRLFFKYYLREGGFIWDKVTRIQLFFDAASLPRCPPVKESLTSSYL